MSVPRRVVIDTSTLVSAALLNQSVPNRALRLAVALAEVCVSAATFAELESVLQRDKFDRYMPRAKRQEFVAMLRHSAHFFVVSAEDEAALRPGCRDPRDDKFLALAQLCEAQVLVSSDADLLVLHPWNGIDIVVPAQFMELVGEAAQR